MLNLFRTTRCRIHDRELEQDTVQVRYGLIRFRGEYLAAKKTQFPHAKLFVMGGCRVGTKESQDVAYCPDCREAENRWNTENPDFDTHAVVSVAVQTQRRSLANSLGKRILRQAALEKPERLQKYQWIVYRISLNESVMYHSLDKTYAFPYATDDSQQFSDIKLLADHLTSRFG